MPTLLNIAEHILKTRAAVAKAALFDIGPAGTSLTGTGPTILLAISPIPCRVTSAVATPALRFQLKSALSKIAGHFCKLMPRMPNLLVHIHHHCGC